MTVDLLSPRDAGRLLGLTSWRVQQLDREGKLTALRDSAGRRLFRKADVLRFKARREQAARKTTPEAASAAR
jgi:DNA-binding transcriptional MerR regulator